VKRILVVSDLHLGSNVAICLPEEYDTDNNQSYTANEISRFYFDKWCEMRNLGHFDMVVVNGDVVDGSNPKSSGIGTYTSDIHSQAVMAAKLLKMIDTDEFLFTDGSAYHTGRFKGGISGDHLTCDLIGGKWLGLWDNFTVEGINLHVQHHGAVSSTPYGRCTPQQKTALLMKAQDTPSDIYIHSHTHKFVFSGNSTNLTIGTPCWKGIDDFIGKMHQDIPDNGYVIIEVENNDYTWKYHIFGVPFAFYKKGMLKF